ncbi:GIY-YIG nuclease family protein [Candidatus Blastococcus massiliensis]|uniref:GIY-YIG nuclease family protein n=1 Tax=Candidatus Blastococcus massiliensis TaxID=1470358 RepID=UPI001AA0C272|nr:GIY-YIG nuclease family protein [Candidatus Blastococcus massiliensis]
MNGKQIRLFLADGTPGGLLTAEIMNWTGFVVAAPRSDLSSLLLRSEVKRTGIYLLLGDDPESPGRQLVYIGEGDDVSKRLYQHARDESKSFWDRAVVLTNKDLNLTKAHARYLESRFIALAMQAGRSRLHNATSPEPVALPEADRSDMEYFISQAKIILPVLGINTLRVTSSSPAAGTRPVGDDSSTGAPASLDTDAKMSPMFVMEHKKSGVRAYAQEVDGEFTVRAGSLAVRAWTGNDGSYKRLRQRLELEMVLVPSADNKTMMYPKDYVFASPSAAAAVSVGRNANGRRVWTLEATGQEYGEWQEEQLFAGIGNKS